MNKNHITDVATENREMRDVMIAIKLFETASWRPRTGSASARIQAARARRNRRALILRDWEWRMKPMFLKNDVLLYHQSLHTQSCILDSETLLLQGPAPVSTGDKLLGWLDPLFGFPHLAPDQILLISAFLSRVSELLQ